MIHQTEDQEDQEFELGDKFCSRTPECGCIGKIFAMSAETVDWKLISCKGHPEKWPPIFWSCGCAKEVLCKPRRSLRKVGQKSSGRALDIRRKV